MKAGQSFLRRPVQNIPGILFHQNRHCGKRRREKVVLPIAMHIFTIAVFQREELLENTDNTKQRLACQKNDGNTFQTEVFSIFRYSALVVANPAEITTEG